MVDRMEVGSVGELIFFFESMRKEFKTSEEDYAPSLTVLVSSDDDSRIWEITVKRKDKKEMKKDKAAEKGFVYNA